jgi:phage-related protein
MHLVQQGHDPFDWKPVPAIGMGVKEIRVHTALEHRVFYVAKFSEGVYVLHAFEKRPGRRVKRTSNWVAGDSGRL